MKIETHRDKSPEDLKIALEAALAHMNDEKQYAFLRHITMLANCYRLDADTGGVLLLRDGETLLTIGINTSYDEAKMLVLAAAVSFTSADEAPAMSEMH